jgi:hypothetical protein
LPPSYPQTTTHKGEAAVQRRTVSFMYRDMNLIYSLKSVKLKWCSIWQNRTHSNEYERIECFREDIYQYIAVSERIFINADILAKYKSDIKLNIKVVIFKLAMLHIFDSGTVIHNYLRTVIFP